MAYARSRVGLRVGYSTPCSLSSDDDALWEDPGDDDTNRPSVQLQAHRPCCCCCTAERFYHIAYVALFLAYLIAFPMWAKWLVTSPIPYRFWHAELATFPLVPQQKTYIALGKKAGIDMSRIPFNPSACNFSCGDKLFGMRSNLMNFEVALLLNESGLARESATTIYPVLLASQDFQNWILVGDRRHARPDPFFRSESENMGKVWVRRTDQCMDMPEDGNPITTQGSYIIACIAWQLANQTALQELKTATTADLNRHCNSVGGVCGWPCGSGIPAQRLEGCSADGEIVHDVLTAHLPAASLKGEVRVYGCIGPEDKVGEGCVVSTQPMSSWPCHQCQQEMEVSEEDEDEDEDKDKKEDESMDAWKDKGGENAFRRRLQEDELVMSKHFLSLPQLQVKVYHSVLPPGADIFSAPRSYIFASGSLKGPWRRIFSDPGVMSVPVGQELPEKPIKREGGSMDAMKLEHLNKLTIRSESCFGQRGPLYLVACAVNQSIYNDETMWPPHRTSRTPDFQLGQEVAPPPFNDRCLAVGGRCGYACAADEWGDRPALPYCGKDGLIQQEHLVGDIEMEFNHKPVVISFVIVLLLGFSLKLLMVCPGIFSPYKHAQYYDPSMTRSFRYIAIVSPMLGADDNKGAMLRNIVGTVACMPPGTQCRYHVTVDDEGHRDEMKTCWQLFCRIIDVVPALGDGDNSYERNVREFTQVWCTETRMMSLPQIGARVSVLDGAILERLCGRSALRKLLRETKWKHWDRASVAPLEAAVEALAEDLRTDYNKFTPSTPYRDILGDWEPRDLASLALRMHYASRAKPIEDSRNLVVQHVAVGSWYYKIPRDASTEDWLELRTRPKEMIYALPDDDDDSCINVPLRSSSGKAGGLNFCDNYLTVVNRRPRNHYGDVRDAAPCLLAIADARHQFQPDFMLSCIPCFFTVSGALDERVAFTQAPQHYNEFNEKWDYMDVNNAQFVRLTAMIRNCCGGVNSCGTNSMWLIPRRKEDIIWEKKIKRVRDLDKTRREHVVEREQFNTSCMIEDIASTLDEVLVGRRSQFVNRKLSFGMATSPTDFIGQQQRWVEGAVTLTLQIFENRDAVHRLAKGNTWQLWVAGSMIVLFNVALLGLNLSVGKTSVFVKYGVISADSYATLVGPFRELSLGGVRNHFQVLKLFGADTINLDCLAILLEWLLAWILVPVFAYLVSLVLTLGGKVLSRYCRCTFPSEMRWWARLLVAMENLTYPVWFWTSFWWLGFNLYTALFRVYFHFNDVGMMVFMLVVNFLNLGIQVTNSMRYAVMTSRDANEVSTVNLDNIWRANQMFFMTGPIQLFSICRGITQFVRYKFYGQDIGGWSDHDLSATSVRIVKYWTTFILLLDVVVWICYFAYSHEYHNSFAACVVITLIALDAVHPCTCIWMGQVDFGKHQPEELTWKQWLQASLKSLILNSGVTSFLKHLAPAFCFLALPILALKDPFFGLAGAYMLVAVGPAH